MGNTKDTPTVTYKNLFKQKGFTPYMFIESLAALIDSSLRAFLIYMAISIGEAAGSEQLGNEYVSIVNILFSVPYLLFLGYAGYMSDKFAKRSVFIGTKIAEVFLTILVTIAILSGNYHFMLFSMFLLMIRTTIFFPAKVGILPELVPKKYISMANSLGWFSVFFAIIVGSVLGGALQEMLQGQYIYYGTALVLLSVLGLVLSLTLPKTDVVKIKSPFPINPFRDLIHGFKRVTKRRVYLISILGIAWFWFIGQLIQSILPTFGVNVLGVSKTATSLLQGFVAIGIALGCVAAGYFSRDKVETGLVPFSSIGMSICLFLLSLSPSYLTAGVILGFFGAFAGLFVIPIYSYLHHYSVHNERGRLFATANYFDTIAMIGAAVVFYLLNELHLHARAMYFLSFLGTVAVTAYCLKQLPAVFLRFINIIITRVIYKTSILGMDNLPKRGGALVVSNHVSYLDGLLLFAIFKRPVHFMIYHKFFNVALFRWIFKSLRFIPVHDGMRAKDCILAAQENIKKGRLVFIFPEGGLTRTGQLQPFKKGLERIMAPFAKEKNIKDQPPIVPLYLDKVWGSILSFERGRLFFKLPKLMRSEATMTFGKPLAANTSAWKVREAVQTLGHEAQIAHMREDDTLQYHFISSVKKYFWRRAIGAAQSPSWSYSRLFKKALHISRQLAQDKNVKKVAVVTSNPIYTAVADLACLLAGKPFINVDKLQLKEMSATLKKASYSHVLADDSVDVKEINVLRITELLKNASPLRNIFDLLPLLVFPKKKYIERFLNLKTHPNNIALEIALGGKIVSYTHHSLVANLQSFSQVFFTRPKDTTLGLLKLNTLEGLLYNLFHQLINGSTIIYSPITDTKTVNVPLTLRVLFNYSITNVFGEVLQLNKLLSENPELFEHVRHIISLNTTGEKIKHLNTREENTYEALFYPEASGIVSTNIPDYQSRNLQQKGNKAGTVGHPLPGVAVCIKNDKGETLAPGDQGTLYVTTMDPNKKADKPMVKTSFKAQIEPDGFITLV